LTSDETLEPHRVPGRQFATQPQSTHLVLYDGVCGLCNRLVQFLLKNDQRALFSFASLQSATGKALVARWGGDPEDLTSFYVVTDFRTPEARVVTKSAAVLFVVRQLGWPWKLARAAGILPAALRDRLYDLVARSRYRVFGRYEQCLIPSEESRSRFVE
jgi:predicted DCC family thiol-disulfide oxidoreductase YuxK